MTRDYFKQSMFNPCFQTKHYVEETPGGITEQKILKIINKINIFKKGKNDKNT